MVEADEQHRVFEKQRLVVGEDYAVDFVARSLGELFGKYGINAPERTLNRVERGKSLLDVRHIECRGAVGGILCDRLRVDLAAPRDGKKRCGGIAHGIDCLDTARCERAVKAVNPDRLITCIVAAA